MTTLTLSRRCEFLFELVPGAVLTELCVIQSVPEPGDLVGYLGFNWSVTAVEETDDPEVQRHAYLRPATESEEDRWA